MKTETHNSARAALGIIVQGYCAMIAAALGDARAVLRISRAMQRHVRRQLKLVAMFDRLALRAELLRNPEMRARVRADLGGEAGMAKWKARRHSARVKAAFRAANGLVETQKAAPNASHSIPSSPPKPSMPHAPPTDRFGQFRLAPIPTGALSRPRAKASRTRTTRVTERRFVPIPVTPEDLAGGAISPPQHLSSTHPPQSMPPAVAHPPPTSFHPLNQSLPPAQTWDSEPPERWPRLS